jgi:hypothetical protein
MGREDSSNDNGGQIQHGQMADTILGGKGFIR